MEFKEKNMRNKNSPWINSGADVLYPVGGHTSVQKVDFILYYVSFVWSYHQTALEARLMSMKLQSNMLNITHVHIYCSTL